VELTVKITPRVAAQVARRLRLAASVRSRSMSAMVNDALDQALPSLEEIRAQLAAGEADVVIPGAAAGDRGPARVTAAGGPARAQAQGRGTGDGGVG